MVRPRTMNECNEKKWNVPISIPVILKDCGCNFKKNMSADTSITLKHFYDQQGCESYVMHEPI